MRSVTPLSPANRMQLRRDERRLSSDAHPGPFRRDIAGRCGALRAFRLAAHDPRLADVEREARSGACGTGAGWEIYEAVGWGITLVLYLLLLPPVVFNIIGCIPKAASFRSCSRSWFLADDNCCNCESNRRHRFGGGQRWF